MAKCFMFLIMRSSDLFCGENLAHCCDFQANHFFKRGLGVRGKVHAAHSKYQEAILKSHNSLCLAAIIAQFPVKAHLFVL